MEGRAPDMARYRNHEGWSVQLRNYQEDVVLKAIQIALEGRPELAADSAVINDVAAYALNRLPPRYIVSERGFTRLAAEHFDDESLGSMVGILMLVNEGISLVERRRPAVGGIAAAKTLSVEEQVMPMHTMPQVFGKIVSSETGAPVHGAEVLLLVNGARAEEARAGWPNPCTVVPGANGYYSFWPAPVRCAEDTAEFLLEVQVQHPDYRPERATTTIATGCVFTLQDQYQADTIVNLDPVVLKPRTSRASTSAD